MKFILPLYLLTCLGPAFLVSFSCRGSATELPVKYIFELSDEPVKVHPGKIDTKSVFFPKYARGTSPETLKPFSNPIVPTKLPKANRPSAST